MPKVIKLKPRLLDRKNAKKGIQVVVLKKTHSDSMFMCGLRYREKLFFQKFVGDPWKDKSEKSYIMASRAIDDTYGFSFKLEDLEVI